jgi:hypothetical protein
MVWLVTVSCGEQKGSAPGGADAHALLDEYVATIQSIAKSGSIDGLEPALDEQQRKGEALKARGVLSDEVARRHRRILDVTRAATRPAAGEAEKQTILEFLDAVEGKKERVVEGGLAQIGPALLEEILSLHMLVDGTSDREKARAKYLGGPGN